MRDYDRIKEVLRQVERVWFKYSDTRFFQLVDWFKSEIEKSTKKDPFYLEDEDLINELRKR